MGSKSQSPNPESQVPSRRSNSRRGAGRPLGFGIGIWNFGLGFGIWDSGFGFWDLILEYAHPAFESPASGSRSTDAPSGASSAVTGCRRRRRDHTMPMNAEAR